MAKYPFLLSLNVSNNKTVYLPPLILCFNIAEKPNSVVSTDRFRGFCCQIKCKNVI